MTTLEWISIILIGVLAIFIPRTILVIIAWNLLEYGNLGMFVLSVFTFIAVIIDIAVILQK